MDLFPAIDLRGGRAVRLIQGDYARETIYSDSPADVAAAFAAQGAACLHLVDLDGARDGAPTHFATVESIIARTGLFTEVGGGIRNETQIRRYLDAGAARVILGTIALTDPDFLCAMVAKYGAQIAVGVDARDGHVATHGWMNISDQDSFTFCAALRDMGVATVIYTDIACDGELRGTNLPAYERLSTLDGLNIVASGGICGTEELLRLREMNLAGAILGKALYAGKLRLPDALAAVRGQAPSGRSRA